MTTIDIERIRATIKRLDEERATEDMERGCCVLDFPPVSDHFAYEVYQRYEKEVKAFLLAYADILLKTNEWLMLDTTTKLIEWIEALDVAGHCADVELRTDCIMMAYYLRKATGQTTGVKGSAQVAAGHIAGVVGDKFDPYLSEMERLDYTGEYDVYLTQKMEEIKQWQNLH
ncbi:MAG: hypothetical protein RR588_02020 [Solibacillus sp.]